MYHVVHYHADGGQMCVPGVRCFNEDQKKEASTFATLMRDQPGHTCADSMWEETSETPVQDDGNTMNEVELMYPKMFSTKGALMHKKPNASFVGKLGSALSSFFR